MKLHWITTRKRLTSLWKVSEILPIQYIINTERSWGGLGTSGEILRAWCAASFWWCLGAFSWRSSFPAFLFLQKKWQASNYQLRKNQRLLKHGFKTTVHDFKMAQLSLSLRLLATSLDLSDKYKGCFSKTSHCYYKPTVSWKWQWLFLNDWAVV